MRASKSSASNCPLLSSSNSANLGHSRAGDQEVQYKQGQVTLFIMFQRRQFSFNEVDIKISEKERRSSTKIELSTLLLVVESRGVLVNTYVSERTLNVKQDRELESRPRNTENFLLQSPNHLRIRAEHSRSLTAPIWTSIPTTNSHLSTPLPSCSHIIYSKTNACVKI